MASEWALNRLAERLEGLAEGTTPKRSRPAPTRTKLRIATYNINNVNRRLPNLLAWLAKAKPDVVCLQELKAE